MYPQTQPNIPALLHDQHRYYTAELASTHQSLSTLYRKLARLERTLAQRVERDLSRREKKKVQWARSLTKSNIVNLELQQEGLYDYVRQCNDLLSLFESQSQQQQQDYGYDYSCPPPTAVSTWTGHVPPSPYPYTPTTPLTPWAQACFGEQAFQQQWPRPQYWDLSMLRERRLSGHTPSFSTGTETSADSGFCEPAMYAQPFHWQGEEPGVGHVFSHEWSDPGNGPAGRGVAAVTGSLQNANGAVRAGSTVTTESEGDVVPELHSFGGLSPKWADKEEAVTPGSEEVPAQRKRRYSENAISLIESRLASLKTAPAHGHRRGLSLGTGAAKSADAAVFQRRASEGFGVASLT